MTLCLLGKGLVWGEEWKRGKVTTSWVRADGIVDAFPSPEIAIEGGELKRVGNDLVELLGMGTLGALDPTIEFGRAGAAGRTSAGRVAGRPGETAASKRVA